MSGGSTFRDLRLRRGLIMGAEAGGGRSYIASTIHKADKRAYTRETLQPRACAALDRESAPRKYERATGGHENLPHLDNVRGLAG